MRLVLALAMMAQVACTVGAPAMNDGDATSALTARITVETRAALPECTAERADAEAYIRDENVVTTCASDAWQDVAPAS